MAVVHYSGEILNLKKKAEVLGLQGFYKEAKALKKRVKALEGNEKGTHEVIIKEKFVNRSQLLVAKQAKEYQSLKKKHWA